MNTYLFLWNPEHYPAFFDDFVRWKKRELEPISWSSGAFKTIPSGSRVFIMRLANEPKGIVASAWTVSDGYQRKWENGETGNANYITIDNFAQPDDPPLLLDDLRKIRDKLKGLWLPMSAVAIPDDVAEQLEAKWDSVRTRTGGEPRLSSIDPNELGPGPYYEGAKRQIIFNAYERNPAARHACVKHYGSTCIVCKFNFEQRYGAIGAGYIHVHHLKPLSSIGEEYVVDAVEDMRPVCANCHAMLHEKSPPHTIEELTAMLRS